MIAIRKIIFFIFSWLLLSVSALAAVNVNTASFDELQTISGIGPATAQRIVDERRKGPFKSLDDLQARVKGIGESRVRKMAAAGLTVGRAAP
jgi:competence protein ComEA